MVFCDVVGSTALGESSDPEALQALLGRYFERMSAIVDLYGGSVEKFIGDAVMAVFGVPAVHEDDALRACRAAVRMREAFPEVGVQGRIGVNTGEVVVGTDERLATGDAVNIAARLQQAAEPDEVLIGEKTFELVREAVETEPVEPLALKGKTQPVPAFRLVSVQGPPERSHARLFVGRDRELAEIEAAWRRVRAERSCALVTIVGDAGIGKSRLVAEALSTLDARVVQGRCLPYGEGITYWPVVEVLKQLDALPTDPVAAASIRSLLGQNENSSSAEEIGWAFRKLLEEQAPLVIVLDDIQWGAETFLDVIEGVALLASGAPLLIVCMGRPELVERRPQWPVTIRLERLPDEAVAELVVGVPTALRARIAEAAGGNPLYLTEVLAMAVEGRAIDVPPTLRSLLAARLDELDVPERVILERGAVEGELFHRGSVQALSPGETRVIPRLAALTRKDLVRPDKSLLPGDDAFRFRHLLIRDAAYEALPKATRAELHERFADWLQEHAARLVELPEILGHHLEQACLYLAELGQDKASADLGARAAAFLGHAGRRAFGRNDMPAAIDLLNRACVLVPKSRPERVRLLSDLGSALGEAGRFDEAESTLDEAVTDAHIAGDRVTEGRARVEQVLMRLSSATGQWVDEARAAVDEFLPVFEEHGDDEALARLWRLSGTVSVMESRNADQAVAMGRALAHARRAGDEREAGLALFWIPQAIVWGPASADEGIRRCEALLEEAAGSKAAEAGVVNSLALLYAMVGRSDEAGGALRDSTTVFRELGLDLLAGAASMHGGPVGLYLGDPVMAERELRQAIADFERLGEKGYRSTAVAWLAHALNEQARYDEAEEATRLSEELASIDDMPSQIAWRAQRAWALAQRGKLDEAEKLSREAIALSEPTDQLDDTGESFLTLAEVMRRAGRIDHATAAACEALAKWEQKGINHYVQRARALLARIQT